MTCLSDKCKVQIYESFLHDLHFAYAVSMNHDRVNELLQLASMWSYAHRIGNGEYTDEEQQEIVNHATKQIAAAVSDRAPQITNQELTAIYHYANNIDPKKHHPITTERIFTAMRAMIGQSSTRKRE